MVGGVAIGGGADIAVQSMANTPTGDIKATVSQLRMLSDAGCDIARVAVPDMEAARAIREIKKEVNIPIVADIHFDYRLALESVKYGADKIRINPGNIGSPDRVRMVAKACQESRIPIRIGVNAGSLERHLLEKYGAPTPKALLESARYNVSLLNQFDFDDICISIKSSDVASCMKAYMALSGMVDYPLHVGITEAGTEYMGTIKSAIGIGGLLAMGIGDTIRVSLTDDPVREIAAAKAILKALNLNKTGVTVISCPTCARCKVNLIEIAKDVENKLSHITQKLTVAVMGCAVNGPGEAREADIGVACGDAMRADHQKRRDHQKSAAGYDRAVADI